MTSEKQSKVKCGWRLKSGKTFVRYYPLLEESKIGDLGTFATRSVMHVSNGGPNGGVLFLNPSKCACCARKVTNGARARKAMETQGGLLRGVKKRIG